MLEQFGQFWQSQTSRLTAFYLAIIMVMSLSFSTIIYFVSASHLDQQVAVQVYRDDNGEFAPVPRVYQYLQQQVLGAKNEMIFRLGILNIFVLLFGVALSYMLARKTLEPIERNVERQTRFVSDVSHELRTPLTAMKLANEVTLRQPKLRLGDARAALEANLDEVNRMQQMTTTLLELVADSVQLTPVPVAVQDSVAQAMTVAAPQAATKNISLDDTIANISVLADAGALTQALTALIDNAIKYSPTDSVVKITTKVTRWRMVRIEVSDSGQGIARDEQAKIFEHFYRSDAARSRTDGGGHGLGLSIARKLVQASGGTIEVASELGKGSTFTLQFPEAKPAPRAKKRTKKSKPSKPPVN